MYQRENAKTELQSFYKYINEADFSSITKEMIENIKLNSKKLNKFFYYDNGLLKHNKYLIIMNRIKTCPKTFNVKTKAEIYLLFMFTVDPEFEMAKIYYSNYKIKDIRFELEKKFGIIDIELIKIEIKYIKKLLSKEEKEKINNEIEERSFK